MAKRVFIGFTDIAGVGTRLEHGFSSLGYRADFYFFNRHSFQYSGGKHLKFSKNIFISRIQKLIFLIRVLFQYDYIIYICSGTGFLSHGNEVRLYKLFRKNTMIIYTGCDVRMPSVVEKFKWNTCTDCTRENKDLVGCNIPVKEKRIRREELYFRHIVSPLECGGFIKTEYNNILFPVDLGKLRNSAETLLPHQKLRILHASTNRNYKGTKYILDAIDRLSSEYDFDFKFVENISIDELYQEIKNSDLIIDGLLAGFTGLFSIESMALGKPVICYIREDLVTENMPIINADPDTIYERIREILVKPQILNQIGIMSRKYVEEYHSDAKVCRDLINIFQNNK
jgi:hypothetical protein